ncbi:MAG: HTTM domain-containing protein [Myxococcales bacterium]|nr:HTTM domain-containing protein [Myxococcales bacterium]
MRRVLDAWFAPAPAERLAAMRILVGAFTLVYVAIMLPVWLADSQFVAHDFRPLGVVRVLDGPLSHRGRLVLVAVTAALAVPFTLGLAYRWVAPVFALALLATLTYRNSWGMPFHTENLLALHVLVLAIVPAADAWSVDRRGRGGAAPDERYGWPLRALALITVITYLLAGVAKLRLGGWAWTDGDALREQIAIDNLRKHLMGAPMSPVAAAFLEHTALMRGLALTTMVVELGAPLALLHRRIAAVWAVAAWGFHVGVLVLMAIVFPYPLVGLAYAPLFRCERPIAWLIRRWRRWRGGAPPAPAGVSTS